jgi:hypothetical protein
MLIAFSMFISLLVFTGIVEVLSNSMNVSKEDLTIIRFLLYVPLSYAFGVSMFCLTYFLLSKI